MAAYSHGERIIPVDLREPLADFLASGLHQIERVCKGPRGRAKNIDNIGYQSKGVFYGLDSIDVCIPSVQGSERLRPASPASAKPSGSHSLAGSKTKHLKAGQLSDMPGSRSPQKESKIKFVGQSPAIASAAIAMTDSEAVQTPLKLISDTMRHVLAGTAARTMSQAIIHPIDTIKTRMQVNKVTAPPLLQAWRQHSKDRTLSIFIGRHRIFKLRHWLVKGPVDLYRGLTCAILGTVPVAMIYFGTYETCKAYLERGGTSGTVSHLASASMGAVMSAFVRVPTDTLRHQTQAYLIPNFVQGTRSILATEGVRGFYHGLLPTLLRDVPELTLQFSMYESLRHAMQEHGQVKKLQTWQHLVLGGISGAIAASATMPLDVTKTALQCGNGHSVRQILGDIVREKGPAGLFAGMGPRVAQIALQGAVFFTLFEAWKAQLKPTPLRLGDDRLMHPKLWQKRRGHVWKRQFVFQ